MKTHRVTLPTPIHAAALRGEVSMLLVRMKPQPLIEEGRSLTWFRFPGMSLGGKRNLVEVMSPYSPGDLIACREPWLYVGPGSGCCETCDWEASKTKAYKRQENFRYSGWGNGVMFRPASRMPLAACRLWFRVQSVEACRVADVTEEEARAMGYREHANCPASYWLPDGLGRWAWKLKVERTERN